MLIPSVKKKVVFIIQISKPAFMLHQRLLRVMAGLLFLAVSKLNLLFIILKEDGKKKKKKREHPFFLISGREKAAIQSQSEAKC